ncbi:MAG: response regulator transcription factor [Empedobacter falsenii]
MKEYEDIEQKLFQIERNLSKDSFDIADISELIPASIMVHSLSEGVPQQIIYMNTWGCNHLGVELEELNALRTQYYEEFFIQEDLEDIYPKVIRYCNEGNHATQLNFFQRVKLYKANRHRWFYTVCKLLVKNDADQQRLIMLSTPIDGVGALMEKVKRVLDENEYIRNNYKKFALLTKREKEILTLLSIGKSSMEIADQLFISKETVATHRKNIIRKLDVKSFAELLRFALAFDLIMD